MATGTMIMVNHYYLHLNIPKETRITAVNKVIETLQVESSAAANTRQNSETNPLLKELLTWSLFPERHCSKTNDVLDEH